MNHQMIVVKLQPLWMLLLRGSTGVLLRRSHCMGGWPLVWAVHTPELPLLQPLQAKSDVRRSTKHRWASLIKFI